jgi:peptide-methionine (S)-S-oxide reductase
MRRLVIPIIYFVLTILSSSCHSQNPKKDIKMTQNNYELATFGGGCFWCTEAIFDKVNGVIKATSGYSGGENKNPTYDEVCSGATGHAEVIQVEFNPSVISYTELLEIFFKTHNPTTPNQQGADRGSQYRSVILYHNNTQKEKAASIIKELNTAKIWEEEIVTELTPYVIFYSAEAYHQEYFTNNSKQMYCQLVIVPKMEKFEALFKDKIKK